MPNPVVLLPVCRPDLHLGLKWLRWARWLSEQRTEPYDLVVFAAQAIEEPLLRRLRVVIDAWPGAQMAINPEHYERHDLGYAACANQMFRAALEATERLFPGRPTLWCESDCIPIYPRWFADIAEEYAMAGKPVMGDFHAPGPIPHVSGNAVYPADWRVRCPSIALLPGPNPEQGWDSACAHETLPISHRSYRIQQTWIVPMPKFTAANLHMIHPETALFHRCKDGSLIDVLARRMQAPTIPLEPPVCRPTPILSRARREREQYETAEVPPPPRSGVQILIVSFRRDAELLSYCMRSIAKYATGFDAVTIMVPVQDVRYIRDVPAKFKLTTFDERPGKGFLHHMIQKCRADEICPDAEHIVHLDSDCILWRPTTPEDFVSDGRCLMVRERYEDVGKRNANRLIWRTCVERATGITPVWENMTRHPQVYPRGLYARMRALVEEHTGMGFDDYVFSCENGFPQGFAEFPTAGAVAIRDMPTKFNFVDYDYEQDCRELGIGTRGHQYAYRPDRDALCEGWSHGGAARYRTDWDAFLAGKVPKYYLK